MLFFLISLKKFQASTKIEVFLSTTIFLFFIGIKTPGIYLLCFKLLSSIIKSISLEIPKKFKAVVALAGAP